MSVVSRRTFVKGLAAGGRLPRMGAWDCSAQWQRSAAHRRCLRGTAFDLSIGETPMNFTGSPKVAQTINGSLPGPLLRWREGDTVTLRVANHARRRHVDPLARHPAAGRTWTACRA